MQARFAREAVRIEGRSTAYVRRGDSGAEITFHFCPACGATVYYEPSGMPEHVVVPVGAFADPTFGAPTVSVYEARKHTWVMPPTDVEHMD